MTLLGILGLISTVVVNAIICITYVWKLSNLLHEQIDDYDVKIKSYIKLKKSLYLQDVDNLKL